MRSSTLTRYGLLTLCFGFLAVFLAAPIAFTVRDAFIVEGPDGEGRFTLSYVADVFRDPVLVESLVNSLVIAVATTLLCLVIALPLSVISTRYEFRGKALLSGLLLVPLILPPFVGAIGLRQIVGRFGSLNAALSHLPDWMSVGDLFSALFGLAGAAGVLALVWHGRSLRRRQEDAGGAFVLAGLVGAAGAGLATWVQFTAVDGAMPNATPGGPGIDVLGGARIWGVIVMEALHLYPIVFLNVTAALANLDPAMEQAADNLGARGLTRFRRVVLPLIMPGVFAGSTIVFIWAFTELGTPLMFDFTSVAPVHILWGVQELESPRPFALVAVVLAFSALFYVVGKLTLGRRSHTATTRAAVSTPVRRLSAGAGLLAALPFVLVTGLAVMPHLGVILVSFTEPGHWYMSLLPTEWTASHYIGEAGAFQRGMAIGSVRNSLMYSLIAMGVDVVLGLTIAYLVVRGRVIGGRALDAMSMMPLAVPGLVMAFGYVAMSAAIVEWMKGRGIDPPSLLQITGEDPNPMLFLVIAYAVRRLPYVVRATAAGLEQTPLDLEEAAQVLGASKLYTIRRVVTPLIMANLIAGGLLAFSFAMLEVSDSLILAQSEEHFPITKAIFDLFGQLGDGPFVASAMGVWGMVLLTITLVGASLMLGKRLGAIFRL